MEIKQLIHDAAPVLADVINKANRPNRLWLAKWFLELPKADTAYQENFLRELSFDTGIDIETCREIKREWVLDETNAIDQWAEKVATRTKPLT